MNPGCHIPVILGRPFLSTSNEVIRCRNGVMTLTFSNMRLKLNIFNNGSQSPEMDDEEEMNMVDVLIGQTIQQSCYQDPLEQCLA